MAIARLLSFREGNISGAIYVQFWGGASLKFNMEPENGRKTRSLLESFIFRVQCIVWISHSHPVAVANESLEGIPRNTRMAVTVTGWGLDPLYSKNWSLKSASVLYGIHRSIESIDLSIHFRTNTGHFLEQKNITPTFWGCFSLEHNPKIPWNTPPGLKVEEVITIPAGLSDGSRGKNPFILRKSILSIHNYIQIYLGLYIRLIFLYINIIIFMVNCTSRALAIPSVIVYSKHLKAI